MILNKQLDVVLVNGVSTTASKAESKGNYLLIEIDNNREVLDIEVIE